MCLSGYGFLEACLLVPASLLFSPFKFDLLLSTVEPPIMDTQNSRQPPQSRQTKMYQLISYTANKLFGGGALCPFFGVERCLYLGGQ